MRSRRPFATFLAGTAWLMQVVGPAIVHGQDRTVPTTAPKAIVASSKPAAKSIIPDISMTKDGKLVGLLVNEQSKPIANSNVQLKLGKQVVTEGKTDERGVFQLETERGGIYQLATEKESVAIRVWTKRSAPPSAKQMAVIMQGQERVVRGQDDGPIATMDLCTAALLSLGIATITVTSITLSKTNSLKSSNADLQRQVQTLQSEIDKVQASLATP